jgi:hypothetical protein
MAIEERRTAPYAAAVELTAEEKPEHPDPEPAVAHAPWIRPIGGLRTP